jgi:hypothetical protein
MADPQAITGPVSAMSKGPQKGLFALFCEHLQIGRRPEAPAREKPQNPPCSRFAKAEKR